jgi:hypothetical protein
MHVIHRLALVPVALVVALLAVACEPTAAALPRLTDPDEVIEETLKATAELDYVHLAVEVEATAAQLGGKMSYVADADIDLGRREFHAVIDGSLGLVGDTQVELLVVGSETFTRTDAAGPWQRSEIAPGTDPRAAIPPNPAIATALQAILADPSVEPELRGMEACGGGECYHVVATITPELIGRLMDGAIFGAPPGQEAQPIDPGVPPVTLDILVDERTRNLVSVATTVTMEGISATITAELSNHDVELRIVAPPPAQVEDAASNEGGGFVDSEILDSVEDQLDEDGY